MHADGCARGRGGHRGGVEKPRDLLVLDDVLVGWSVGWSVGGWLVGLLVGWVVGWSHPVDEKMIFRSTRALCYAKSEANDPNWLLLLAYIAARSVYDFPR